MELEIPELLVVLQMKLKQKKQEKEEQKRKAEMMEYDLSKYKTSINQISEEI